MTREPEPSVELPWLSIVVPMKNESQNVVFLTEAIALSCAPYAPFEAIYVDDASGDGTSEAILALRGRFPFLRQLRHPAGGGQSAAIDSGVRAARGAVICTLDGDGQNPPAEIPKLLAKLRGRAFPPGVGLIAGQRVGRRDTVSKRWASRVANVIRGSLLRDGTRDTGCGLKLFDRDAFLALPYFDHMHRYLSALFAREGWGIILVDVGHAPRHAGQSNYANLGRALAGASDLLGVLWLMRRRKKTRPVEIPPPGTPPAPVSPPPGSPAAPPEGS